VTLLSAPGAGAFAGVGWWRAMVAAARAAHPLTPCCDLLDCGPAPGRALEALRAGQKLLILRCDPRIWDDLAERARACGGRLFAAAPPALDFARRGADRDLLAWLHAEASPGDRR
jgi:hypothetical protein